MKHSMRCRATKRSNTHRTYE